MTMLVQAKTLETTILLAQAFGQCITATRPAPILLYGQLGAGKTTFIRHLVEMLPGSQNAEISSPSFNILNLYPTTPPVGHFDLYRTEGTGIEGEIEEALGDSRLFCLVEWSEYLPQEACPDVYIAMTWTITGSSSRNIELRATGPEAQALLACIQRQFNS